MSEHTPLTEAERERLNLWGGIYGERQWKAIDAVLAARTSTGTADTGLRERVANLHALTEGRNREGAPTADTGARDELTQAGLYLRDAAAEGNPNMEPWSFVPCAREHRPGYLCIQPDGHDQ